jgi:hypothetical protein
MKNKKKGKEKSLDSMKKEKKKDDQLHSFDTRTHIRKNQT